VQKRLNSDDNLINIFNRDNGSQQFNENVSL